MGKVNLKRISKIFLILILSLFVLALIVAIGLRTLYFTDHKIKQIATETLSGKLDRLIQIDSLDISIFSGVRLKGLQIHDPPDCGGELFLRLRSLKVKYRLLSLLKKQVEIQTVVVDEPEIFIRQLSDNLWNFSDFLEPRRQEPPALGDTSELELPLLLVVKSIKINNASVHLSGPGELHLSGIDFDIKSLSFRSPEAFSLTALFQISPGDGKNLSVTSVST
ncbi:MAG: AsmA family protein, partial [Candidatus Zixiibacteriota bacterium]